MDPLVSVKEDIAFSSSARTGFATVGHTVGVAGVPTEAVAYSL